MKEALVFYLDIPSRAAAICSASLLLKLIREGCHRGPV